jgi:hypothetical protein
MERCLAESKNGSFRLSRERVVGLHENNRFIDLLDPRDHNFAGNFGRIWRDGAEFLEAPRCNSKPSVTRFRRPR